MPIDSQGLIAINVFDLSSILGRPVFAFVETLGEGLAIGSGAEGFAAGCFGLAGAMVAYCRIRQF